MLAWDLSRFYIAIHSLSMYQLLDKYLAKLPTIYNILDHNFYWHSQYYKHTYRGGRWKWWGAMKWQAKAMSTLKTVKWCPSVPFFQLHITHTAAKSMAKLTSQLCGDGCWVLRCPWVLPVTTQALMDIWKASETSHSKSSLGTNTYPNY